MVTFACGNILSLYGQPFFRPSGKLYCGGAGEGRAEDWLLYTVYITASRMLPECSEELILDGRPKHGLLPHGANGGDLSSANANYARGVGVRVRV